jgi:hypothetical protein
MGLGSIEKARQLMTQVLTLDGNNPLAADLFEQFEMFPALAPRWHTITGGPAIRTCSSEKASCTATDTSNG